MIKLICFVKRKPGMDREEFHRYWREVHGPKVRSSRMGSHVVRYEQHHRSAGDYAQPGRSEYDGVTVQWFRSMAEFDASLQEPDFADIAADMDNFMDTSSIEWIMTDEPDVIIDGA